MINKPAIFDNIEPTANNFALVIIFLGMQDFEVFGYVLHLQIFCSGGIKSYHLCLYAVTRLFTLFLPEFGMMDNGHYKFVASCLKL